MRKSYCFILLLVFFQCSYLIAQDVKTNIVSIKPSVPKIGEKIKLTVSYKFPEYIQAKIYSYIFKDSKDVQFVKIQSRKTVGNKVEMLVVFYAKRPGIITFPTVMVEFVSGTTRSNFENKMNISLPSVYIWSEIINRPLQFIPDSIMFPGSAFFYGIVFVCSLIALIIILKMFIAYIKCDLFIRNIIYRYSNKRNVRVCLKQVKKLKNRLHKMGLPKFYGKRIYTYECYRILLLSIRKRMTFLLGEKTLSFTHDEIKKTLLEIVAVSDVSEELRKSLSDFFDVLDKVLYGNQEQEYTTKIQHCIFVSNILSNTIVNTRRPLLKNIHK